MLDKIRLTVNDEPEQAQFRKTLLAALEHADKELSLAQMLRNMARRTPREQLATNLPNDFVQNFEHAVVVAETAGKTAAATLDMSQSNSWRDDADAAAASKPGRGTGSKATGTAAATVTVAAKPLVAEGTPLYKVVRRVVDSYNATLKQRRGSFPALGETVDSLRGATQTMAAQAVDADSPSMVRRALAVPPAPSLLLLSHSWAHHSLTLCSIYQQYMQIIQHETAAASSIALECAEACGNTDAASRALSTATPENLMRCAMAFIAAASREHILDAVCRQVVLDASKGDKEASVQACVQRYFNSVNMGETCVTSSTTMLQKVRQRVAR